MCIRAHFAHDAANINRIVMGIKEKTRTQRRYKAQHAAVGLAVYHDALRGGYNAVPPATGAQTYVGEDDAFVLRVVL